MKSLAEFIHAEMQKRGMSAREFAELCDIATGTMSALANGKNIKPTLVTLSKLAKTTGADLIALIELVYPGVVHTTYPPDILLLARELADLRKKHESVYDFLVGFVRSQPGPNNGKK